MDIFLAGRVMTKEQEFEQAVTKILELLGEDPNREGLKKTPHRVYKAFEHNTYTDSIIYKNLTPLVQNKYIDVKEIPKKDRENFLLDDPKYKTFVPGDVYPGTTLKGENYYGPYQPFRIGNFIIISRKSI